MQWCDIRSETRRAPDPFIDDLSAMFSLLSAWSAVAALPALNLRILPFKLVGLEGPPA
jgi:hypothetical protein